MPDLFGPLADLRSRDTDRRHVIVLATGQPPTPDVSRASTSMAQVRDVAGSDLAHRPAPYRVMDGGRPLVEQTVWRGMLFAGTADRVLVSTSRSHRPFVSECLGSFENVHTVEQPAERGSVPALLLPLLHVLVRDPWATVLVLPSDHRIRNEPGFTQRLVDSLPALVNDPDIVLVGGASSSDGKNELSWAVPGEPQGPISRISRVVERPGADLRARLERKGAMANTSILLGTGGAIARLIRRHSPDWWKALVESFFDPSEIESVFRTMKSCDLSRAVLSPGAAWLGLVPLDGLDWERVPP